MLEVQGSNTGSAVPKIMGLLTGKQTRRCLSLALVAAALVWLGCSPRVPEITVTEQDAKFSPIIVGSGSVFMKIINTGRGDDALVRAQVSMPGAIVELHEVNDDGKMVRTDLIRIPAKSTVRLRPAGAHVMIFKMPKEVQEGHQFILTLSFERTGDLRVPMQFTSNVTHTNRRRR